MKSDYKPVGDLVEKVDIRNKDGEISKLLGLSIDKCYIDSVANTIGTDLTKYKVLQKNFFACSLMQVSRDNKIPICRYDSEVPAIISPAYPMFRVKNESEIMPEFLDMWFKRSEFDREVSFVAVGGVRGSMPWEDFCKVEVPVPPIEKQKAIVKAYQVVTDRIALKEKINGKLEEQMKIYFKEFFFKKKFSFTEEPLDQNIMFSNGLAMQKFEPSEGESQIPVIKIRELNQGYCDNQSNICTDKLKETALIEAGDIIFSWSGTLIVDCWADVKGGLNQHLFKVTSNSYPKWFIYLWISYHIHKFIRIAENKGTTFGHIKREDLANSIIKTPTKKQLDKLDAVFSPIFSCKHQNSLEIRKLQSLQTLLLSRLATT